MAVLIRIMWFEVLLSSSRVGTVHVYEYPLASPAVPGRIHKGRERHLLSACVQTLHAMNTCAQYNSHEMQQQGGYCT